MYNKLSVAEIEFLRSKNAKEDDINFINNNYDIIFKGYQELLLKGKFNEIKRKITEHQEEVKKEDKKFIKWDTLPLEELMTIKINVSYKTILVKYFENKVYSTFNKFYKDLKKINLKDIIEYQGIITKSKIIVDCKDLHIIDIFKLIFGTLNTYTTLIKISELTGALIVESEIIKKQEKILVENKKIIEELYNYIPTNQYDFLKNHLYILQKFYDLGLVHLSPITSKSSQSMFFFSNRKMAEYLQITHPVINYTLNWFMALGFLNKLNNKDVPLKIRKNAEAYKEEIKEKLNTKANINIISFYSYTELNLESLKEIIDNLKIFMDSKSAVYKFTESECNRIFGKEMSEIIYRNYSDKTRKAIMNRIKRSKENDEVDCLL